jgi:hypothetical protein
MTGPLEGASATAMAGDFGRVTPPTALTRESLTERVELTNGVQIGVKPGISAGMVIEPIVSVPDPSSWMPQPEPPLRRPPIRPDFETTFVPPPLPQSPSWPPPIPPQQRTSEPPRPPLTPVAAQGRAGLEIVQGHRDPSGPLIPPSVQDRVVGDQHISIAVTVVQNYATINLLAASFVSLIADKLASL